MRIALVLVISSVLAGVFAGCARDGYVGPGVYAFALTPETPALVETDDGALYVIEQRIALPLRTPTQDERRAMRGTPVAPFASVPFVKRGDIETRIDYVVSNLGDDPITVTVTMNASNEFDEYAPQFVVTEEGVLADYANYEATFTLAPGERRLATITEEKVNEALTDLATVVNGAPNSNRIVYVDNQSGSDLVARPFIPALIPGPTAFRMGLRTEAPGTVVLETSLRTRDVARKLATDPAQQWTEVPTPRMFVPVAPPMM